MTGARGLVLVWLATAGCAPGTVTRVVDGVELEGRPIAAEAYAAYVKAELFAAQGDRKQALRHLEQALDVDPGSPELLTRYGDLLCEERQVPAARETLERALERDPTYAPAFLARARCEGRLGDHQLALVAARTAADLDPMSLETTREVARLLFVLRRPKQAWLWLEARALLEPRSRAPQGLLLEAAEREHDRARAARARAFLASTAAPDGPKSNPWSTGAAAIPPLQALERAERRLAADPEDTEAWSFALAAADLLNDEPRFEKILLELGENPLPPSPAALARLAEVIGRRCGAEAAAALTRGAPGPKPR